MKLKDLPPEAQNAYRVWKSGGDPLAQADQQGELGAVYAWATSLDDPDSAKFLSEQNLSSDELNEVARINLLGAKAPVVQSGIEAAREVRRTQESPALDSFGGPMLEGVEQFSLNALGTGARALQFGGEVLRNYPEAVTEEARRERQPIGPITPPEFRETSTIGDFADEWGEMADRLHNASGQVSQLSSRQGFSADVQRGVGGSVPYLITAPLGAPAMVGLTAVTSASGKFAETGSVPQAMVAGTIEGVVTGAFSAAGLSGLEGAFTKGLRRGFMETGKQTLAEVGEEETIFALQTIADMVAEGKDPSTVDWGQLGYEAAVTAAAAAGPTALLEGSKAFSSTPPADTPPPPPVNVDQPSLVTVAQPTVEPTIQPARRRAGITSPAATPPGDVAPLGGFVPTEQEWETEYIKAAANPATPTPQIDDQPGIQTMTADMAALSSLQDMSLYQIADPTPTGNANINSLKPGGTSISPVEIPISRFLEPPDTDTKHEPTIYLSGSIVPPPANIAETRVGNPARFSPDRRSVVVGEEESNLLFHIGLGGQFAESEGMIRAHQSEQGRSGALTTSMPRVTLESSAKAAKQQADNLRLGIQMMNTGPQGVTSLTQDFLLDSLERAGKLDEQGLDVVEQVTANIQDLAVQRFTAIENILSGLSETDRQRVKANPETAKEFFGNAILDLNVPPADLRRLLATNDRSVRLNYIAMDTAIDAINHVHGLMEIEQQLSIPDGADQLRGRKTSEVSILPVRPQNLPQSALATVNENGQVRVFADVPTGKNSLVQAKKQQQPPVGQRPGDVAPNELLYPKELRVKGDKGTSVTGVQQVGSHRLEGTNRMGMGYENGARPRKTDPVWSIKDRTGTKVGGRPTDYYTAMKKAQAYERAHQIASEKYKMQELDATPVQAPPEFGPLEPTAPVAIEPTPEMPGLLPEVAAPTPPAAEFEPGVAEQGPRPMPTEAPLPLEVFEPLGGAPVDVAAAIEASSPTPLPPRIASLKEQYTELYAADPEAASEKLWFQMQDDSDNGVDPAEFEQIDSLFRNAVASAKEAALIAPESGGARVIADVEEAAVVADDIKAQVEIMLDAGIPIDQAVEAAAKAEGVSSAQAGQLLGPNSNTPAVTIKADAAPVGARLTVDPAKDGVQKARNNYFRKHADYLQNDDAVSTPEEIEDRLLIKKVFRETYGDTATEQAWQTFMRTGEAPKMGKGAGKKATPTRRADTMPHGLTPTQLMSEESRSAPIKKASPEELVYMGFRSVLDRMQEQGADVAKVRNTFQGLVERTVKDGEWAAYAQLVEWTNGMKNGGRLMNDLHAAMKERGTAVPTDPLLKHDLPPDAVVPWSVNDPKERGTYNVDPSTPETEFLKTIDLNDPKYANMTDAQWEKMVEEGIKKQPVVNEQLTTEQQPASEPANNPVELAEDKPTRRRAAAEKEPQPRKRLAPTSAKIVNPNVALKTFRDTLKRAGIKPPKKIQGSKLVEDDFGGKLPPGYWNKDGAYSWDTALQLAVDLDLIRPDELDPSKLRELLTGPASETVEVPLFSELYSGESLKVISIYGDEVQARRAIDNQRAQLVKQGEDTSGIDRLIAEFDAVAEEKTTSTKNQEDMFGYQGSQSLKPQATNSDFVPEEDDLPFRRKPRRIDPMDGMPALAEAMNTFDAVRQLVDAGALAYEKVKPHLSVLYRAAKDVPTFISNTVREFGEAIYAHALRVVAEYKALGNRGAALNPATVLSETRRRREALSKSFFGTKPGQTVAHWLKTGGNLNDASVKSLRKHKAWLLSMQKRTDLTNAEFSQILEEAYGAPDKIPAAHIKQINNYINGDTSMATFGVLQDNPKLLDNLTRMRREIDDLSQFMIDEGVVDGKLAATFGANIGVYLRRAYRIHNDPNWVQYLKAKEPATFNRLRAHIEDMHDTARVPFMERNELLSLAHLHFIKNPTGDSLANMKNVDLVKALMQVTDTDISLRADDMTHKILLEQQEKNGGIVPMSNMVKGDTSILMKRKLGDSNFHLALRAAMGEFDGSAIGDVALNHTNSVLRIAKTLSAYRFLSEFKDVGLDPNAKFLWSPEEPGKAQAGATKQIVADNNRALAPLNGMYTTPEVYTQLMDAIGARSSMLDAFAAKGNGAPALVGAYRMLQFINGFAKMGKTVGSVPTQMVNMYGALWVQLEHGNSMTVKDVPHVYKTLRAWDQVKRGRGDAAAFRKKHAAVFERWVKHRLMDENPDVNEAMAQLMEFTDNTAMGKKLAGLYDKARKAMKQQSAGADKALDTATAVLQEIQDHYQRVDATGRIVFFEAELEKYRKALHGDTPLDKLSDAERQFLEDKAEDTAFKVYVNYTDVPRFVQEWRKQPFFGPFITFAFQRIRTTMNSAILIEKELTDPNPEVQKIGRRRAAGFAISQLLLTPTLSTMSMMAVPTLMASVFDGDDDEEEKIPGLDGSKHTHSWSDDHMLRRFLPDWLQNSQLFWGGVDRPEGAMGPVYHVGDLSRFDPSGQMKQALTAVTQGGAAGKSALDIVLSSAFQVLEPFTDPGLVGQTAYNLVAGRSAVDFEGIGREGGINTDIALEQANKVMYELYELLKPGTVQYAERGYKGIFYEPASPYGRRNDPTNELLSMVTGMRSYPVDLGVALKQQGGAYKKRTADIVYDNYTQKVAYTGSEPVGSEDAIAKVSERMAREWDYLRASVQYSVKLGMTRNEVERALKDAGLSETDRSLLWRDREFPGWKPADQRKKSGGSSRRRAKL